jgi:phage tail-like protein
MTPRIDPASSLSFYIRVPGYDAVGFTGIDGLSAEYDVQKYEEGGENTFVHQLPGRIRYTNIKLTRPVESPNEARPSLAAWFSTLVKAHRIDRLDATVTAFDGNHRPVAVWNLRSICPIKYTGPSFSMDNAKAAVESVEFAHNGFF